MYIYVCIFTISTLEWLFAVAEVVVEVVVLVVVPGVGEVVDQGKHPKEGHDHNAQHCSRKFQLLVSSLVFQLIFQFIRFVFGSTYRMFRKNCVFFTIHCNPSLTYIARCKRPSKLSTQCECTVTPID